MTDSGADVGRPKYAIGTICPTQVRVGQMVAKSGGGVNSVRQHRTLRTIARSYNEPRSGDVIGTQSGT